MDEEKRVTVRIPADLHARVAAQAKADRRSLNSEILYLLEAGLARTDAAADRSA
ncbi:Arc family DNA-binding protein [Nocardiopsis kunsanensis]|uniref:Arc family DNA-binding protein n=1 Tax=Nocardiopsis kunsanensis TaxID=141693 RepID=UPI000A067850|nr:Arc family DNA-binding protein [Nocardiopsis kunsanensis]